MDDAALTACITAITELSSEPDDTVFVNVLGKRKKTKVAADKLPNKKAKKDTTNSTNRKDFCGNINIYQLDEFRDKFRMSKKNFAIFERLLAKPFAKRLRNQHTGRSHIPLRERLLLTFWTLSNQESFKRISGRFGIAGGTAYKVFMDTCYLIKLLTKDFIVWPTSFSTISKEFKELNKKPFPGVIGVVNCVDIPILTPAEDKASYYNRLTSVYSIKMQAVCDSHGRFLNVFVGYPGACHDTEMWRASRVYELLHKKSIKLSHAQHFIAGETYPLDTFLMTPYKEENILSQREKYYNEILLESQSVSQKAFNQLKGRFKRLSYLQMSKIPEMKILVLVSCILHNFILIHEEDAAAENFNDNCSIQPRITDDDSGFLFDFDNEIRNEVDLEQAIAKRDSISKHIMRNM